MSLIVEFAQESARDRARVGGKGANLGLMAQAGFPVPPGFVVTTEAYGAFVASTGLADEIAQAVQRIAYDDPASVERETAEVRRRLVESAFPAPIETAVLEAYRTLGGPDAYVAVRSSGTAEDTAEASFAGLHDTYLDVRGEAALLDAVKRCWASLWTARVTTYRHDKHFDHGEAQLAVVVQIMVDSEVAGVMFTANPLTGATDETVVNASWGLGESVVSGIVTPDEFVLSNATFAVRRQTLGDKAVEIVRDPDAASGTITRDVAPERQAAASLDARQLHELGAIGARVTSHYGRMPQDLEWAYAAGRFYVLQSRDITGTTLAWDEDVDAWQTLPADEDDVWTRAFADEWWTGAITPLFYSIRTREQTECHVRALTAMGLREEAQMRVFKYYNAEVYWNASVERIEAPQFIPRFLRNPGVLARMPSSWWAEATEAPFSWVEHAKLYARLMTSEPNMGPNKWIDVVYDYLDNRTEEADGLSDEETAALDDAALKTYLDERIEFWVDFNHHQWAGFFIFAPCMLTLLGDLLGRWYDGTNPQAFADLMTGLPKQTVTLKENHQLWKLAMVIRENPALRELFEANPGAAFFEVAEEAPEGQEFMAEYAALLREHGHRGQADRDFWFPRRIENPAGDYNSLRSILSSDSTVSPAEAEAATHAVRESATDEILANLRRKPLGFLKVEIFKLLLHEVYRFLVVRDDERHYIDRMSWTKKRALMEINRRVMERGGLDAPDDYFFLTKEELYDVLDGRQDERLTRAKIAGRRHNFEQFDQKLVTPPAFLQRGESVDLDAGAEEGQADDGVLRGMGTSRGTVTGPARIIRSMDEIGRVAEGDIMVCQATDPGWTPVFLVISGLVLETGGMLAHGSCLSREYGLPAVQIRNAMNLIEEGSIITVNGETGEVTVAASADEPAVA